MPTTPDLPGSQPVPPTEPFDEIGAALDRASRVSLKVREVVTDGVVHRVSDTVKAIAAELGYWRGPSGHPNAGRFQPDDRVRKVARDIRLEWDLRALKTAGLGDADAQRLHDALDLPAREPAWEQLCDDLDRRNAAVREANLSGETNGARWRIQAPAGFRWPVLWLTATLPDGSEVSGRMDLRDYVATHIGRLMADAGGDVRC